MHEHRNDEIISYLRSGRMQHTDSAGRSEAVSLDRLMVMNAEAGFSHEVAVLGDNRQDGK
jgi:redox-sensitive bicupin YhaK (pirin superfamily)